MDFDERAGVVAGACGNPANLAYTNKLAPMGRIWAMPRFSTGMTIVKTLFVDIMCALSL
jgi:putative transport protein